MGVHKAVPTVIPEFKHLKGGRVRKSKDRRRGWDIAKKGRLTHTQYLRRHWGTMSVDSIAAALGRSTEAIAKRAALFFSTGAWTKGFRTRNGIETDTGYSWFAINEMIERCADKLTPVVKITAQGRRIYWFNDDDVETIIEELRRESLPYQSQTLPMLMHKHGIVLHRMTVRKVAIELQYERFTKPGPKGVTDVPDKIFDEIVARIREKYGERAFAKGV